MIERGGYWAPNLFLEISGYSPYSKTKWVRTTEKELGRSILI
jgi:hypothetical protein